MKKSYWPKRKHLIFSQNRFSFIVFTSFISLIILRNEHEIGVILTGIICCVCCRSETVVCYRSSCNHTDRGAHFVLHHLNQTLLRFGPPSCQKLTKEFYHDSSTSASMILCEKQTPVIFYSLFSSFCLHLIHVFWLSAFHCLPLLLDWTYCRLQGLFQDFTSAEMEVNSYYISYVLLWYRV